MRASAARRECEQDFRETEDEVPVGHDAQVAGPGQFRADGECRTVECDEDRAAQIHLQEGRVEAVELRKCFEPSHPGECPDNQQPIDESREHEDDAPVWTDMVMRLSKASYVSIAAIRGPQDTRRRGLSRC